jgi:hypothetical protein
MTTALIVYIAVGLGLGTLASWAEIRLQRDARSNVLDRASGPGTFKSPVYPVIGIGLFVAVFWPLLLIGMATA